MSKCLNVSKWECIYFAKVNQIEFKYIEQFDFEMRDDDENGKLQSKEENINELNNSVTGESINTHIFKQWTTQFHLVKIEW